MIKAILFDADGVCLKQQPYFSLEIAKENNIPYAQIEPFYKNEFRLCQIGKADIKEELAKYLPQWKWEGSVDDFLTRWFTTDVHPDPEVLAVADEMRKRGIKCYLVSDQEKNRGEYIRTTAGLGSHFDGTFFSYEVGYQKSEPQFFLEVLKMLKLEPSELVYWDDDQKNVDVAKAIGIDARFWNGLDALKATLSE